MREQTEERLAEIEAALADTRDDLNDGLVREDSAYRMAVEIAWLIAELRDSRAALQRASEDTKRLEMRNEELAAALNEISKGQGAFSMDQLTHAENVIERSRRIAVDALDPRPRIAPDKANAAHSPSNSVSSPEQ